MLVVAAAAAVVLLPLAALRRPTAFYLAAGLMLVSSDRFLALPVGSLTLKPSYPLFALSAALGTKGASAVVGRASPEVRRLGVIVLLLIAATVGSTVVSSHPAAGVRQLVVIVGGAILPCLAVASVAGRGREECLAALKWFLAGQMLAAAYGLYQLTAFELGLPQGLVYRGVAGDVGRIASFAYEPAFFAAYVLTAVPLVASDAMRRIRRLTLPPWLPFTLLLVTLLLANARAAYLALPIAVLGPLFMARSTPHMTTAARRRLALLLACVALAAGATFLVRQVNPLTFVTSRVASVIDTKEARSNALRLRLYRSTWSVISDHPWTGTGPGSLGHHLPAHGYRLSLYPLPAGYPASRVAAADVVANSIWLQALVDTGVPGATLTLALLVWLLGVVRVAGPPEPRMLALGGFVFLAVSGAVTSLFWDMRLWVVIGLIVAWRLTEPSRRREESEPAMEPRGALSRGS